MRQSPGQTLFILIVLVCSFFVFNQNPFNGNTSAAPAPTRVANPLPNGFEISFDKAGVVLLCACMLNGQVPLPYELRDPRTLVSITTNTAVRGPLIYHYEVTGGKILNEGPNVVWDFSDLPPGEYKITVTVTDALDPIGKTVTKSVPVAYANCKCPCNCPSIDVESNLSSVRRGEVVKFGANVRGSAYSEEQLKYEWKVSLKWRDRVGTRN